MTVVVWVRVAILRTITCVADSRAYWRELVPKASNIYYSDIMTQASWLVCFKNESAFYKLFQSV